MKPCRRGLVLGRTLSVAYGDSSPEGRALGKEGRSRPYSSTAGRSLPLSSKLYAPAKASPFRERWHGEAVTERVVSRTNPLSLAALDSSFPFLSETLPKRPVHPHGPFFVCGIDAGERGAGRTPSVISLCEMPLPLFVAWRRHLPPAGGSLSTQVEPLAKRAGLVLTGQRQEEACR